MEMKACRTAGFGEMIKVDGEYGDAMRGGKSRQLGRLNRGFGSLPVTQRFCHGLNMDQES